MKLLVTGAGGMLGSDVVLAAENAGHAVRGFGHTELDITDPDALRNRFEIERPDVVFWGNGPNRRELSSGRRCGVVFDPEAEPQAQTRRETPRLRSVAIRLCFLCCLCVRSSYPRLSACICGWRGLGEGCLRRQKRCDPPVIGLLSAEGVR